MIEREHEMLLIHAIEIINLVRAAHDDVKAARGKAEQFAGRDLIRALERIELHIDAALSTIYHYEVDPNQSND